MGEVIKETIQYISGHQDMYIKCIQEHIFLSFVTLAVCIVLGVPLGYICGKNDKVSSGIITVINMLRIVPSVAMFMILVPIVGLGTEAAIIALVVYSLPTIIVNTMGGVKNIKPSVIESAIGMGMSPKEICFRVDLPLAGPMIMTGIKISLVQTIAGATIASFVGAGGLGEIVYAGIESTKIEIIFAGSLTVAFLAVLMDALVTLVNKKMFGKLNEA